MPIYEVEYEGKIYGRCTYRADSEEEAMKKFDDGESPMHQRVGKPYDVEAVCATEC